MNRGKLNYLSDFEIDQNYVWNTEVICVSEFEHRVRKHRYSASNFTHRKTPLQVKKTLDTSKTLSRRTKCLIFKLSVNENLPKEKITLIRFNSTQKSNMQSNSVNI